MPNTKDTTALRYVAGGFAITISLMAIFFMVAVFNRALSGQWAVVGVCLAVALGLSLPMRSFWRWITGKGSPALPVISNILGVFPILFLTAYGINQFNPKQTELLDVEVTKVYKQTRYRSKRVSRRVYTRGAPYTVYRIDVTTPDGKALDMDVKAKVYRSVSKGDTVALPVRTGVLGISTFDGKGIILSASQTPEAKRESQREKRHRAYRRHIDKVLNARYGKRKESDSREND